MSADENFGDQPQKDVQKYEVTVLPTNQTIEIEAGETLLHAARRQNLLIKSTCGGVAQCRKCVVKIIAGEEKLSPMEFEEYQMLGNVFHITRERLSCQMMCTGNITIDISDHMDAKPQDVGSYRKIN